jgi:DNA damage-inducible protein 1
LFIVILQKNFKAPAPTPSMGAGFGSGSMQQPSHGRAGDDFLSQFMGSLGGGAPTGGSGQMPPHLAAMLAGGGGGGGPNMATMDPLSEEYQKALENKIQQDNINENYSYANEFNPELFTHTTMLYIECSINGHEIQAFVDSGAQSTIMSSRCAERCNLMKLLDKRFHGIAQGVGTSVILGKIHAAQIQIGTTFFTTSITVLEDNKIDMLYGLDNLKRHKCCIDLAKNQLTLNDGEVHVPFLADNKIVRQIGEESKDELIDDKDNKMPESEKITELMKMGFEESASKKALTQAGGNLQVAASILANQ